jgi:hypothetical protein
LQKAELARKDFARHRVLVKFKHKRVSEAATRALSRAGLRRLKSMRSSKVSVLEITQRNKSVGQVMKELKASGMVEYAEPDYRVSIASNFPDDPRFEELWGLHNTGQTGGSPGADINATGAWDLTTGDREVIVAVIDTGVDYTHEDLAGNMWANPGEVVNGVDDDGNGYVDDVHGINAVLGTGDPFDDHRHGTHVAGTIGAVGNNGVGVAGVSWDVRIMALKFLDASGDGFVSDAIECLEYAAAMKTEHGVNLKLSSNSWSGGGFSQALRDAIDATGQAGMLFVAAAGNDYLNDNDSSPVYPSSYDLPSVVSVAATDHNDDLAWFSNFGRSSVDLGAPGVDILSSVPGNGYAYSDGTSMAAPHVSGTAALLWSVQPDADALGIKDLLLSSVDPAPALENTVSRGRLNVYEALSLCERPEPRLRIAPEEGFKARLREGLVVTVALRECTSPITVASVTVTPNGEEALLARDDGVAPDAQAADGIYSVGWWPTAAGSTTLTVVATLPGATLTGSLSGTAIRVPEYAIHNSPFGWVDATVGTNAGVFVDDGHVEIPIGFGFDFYGETYEYVRISSNGFLTFSSDGSYYENQPLPSGAEPNGVIAPYWDDLDPSLGGSVYYLLEGEVPNRRLTIEWHDVPYFDEYDDGVAATFAVTLFERTSGMKFQYQNVEARSSHDGGASATVGIEDPTGSFGLQRSFNRGGIADGSAILITETRCGLLGIELLVLLPLVAIRRRLGRV